MRSKAWFAIPCAALLVLVMLYFRAPTVEYALVFTFGGMLPTDVPNFLFIAMYSVVLIVPFVFFGGILPEDMDRAAVFIFPRSLSRFRWYAKSIGRVLIHSFFYFSLLIVTFIGGLLLFKVPVQETQMLFHSLAWIILLVVLNHLVFSLLANVLALRLKQVYIFLLIWFVYVPGQIMVNRVVTSPLLKMLYPSSHAVISLHDVGDLKTHFSPIFDAAIPSFTIAMSTLYNVTLLVIIIVLGAFVIERKNLTI